MCFRGFQHVCLISLILKLGVFLSFSLSKGDKAGSIVYVYASAAFSRHVCFFDSTMDFYSFASSSFPFPNLYTSASNILFITSRTIQTTKNGFVDYINDMLIMQSPYDIIKVYTADAETLGPKD